MGTPDYLVGEVFGNLLTKDDDFMVRWFVGITESWLHQNCLVTYVKGLCSYVSFICIITTYWNFCIKL